MAIFEIELTDGQVVEIEGDGTLEEAQAALASGDLDGQIEAQLTVSTTTATPDAEVSTQTSVTDIGDNADWLDVITTAASNIPESAKRFGKDIMQVVENPLESAQQIGDMFFGLIDKVMPDAPSEEREAREAKADLLISFAKERYGSVDKLKKTLANDPVGALADLATVVVPGGLAFKGAGTAAQMANLPRLATGLTRVGGAVAKVGAVVDPIQAGAKVARAPFRLLPASVPSKLYQSAVKFSTKLDQKTRALLTKTGLDNKIMPTINGLEKVRNQIQVLGAQIDSLIDTATATGATIEIKEIMKGLTELRKQKAVLGPEAVKKINKVMAEIKRGNRKPMTPRRAQTLKQQLYQDLKDVSSITNESPIAKQAKKAIALGTKEAIETLVPEVKGLNAQQGARLELAKEIERAASRIDNREIIGLGSAQKATAGGVAGGLPGVIGGASVGILELPKVKAKLAIVLNQLGKKGPGLKLGQAAIDLGLQELIRIEATDDEEQQ